VNEQLQMMNERDSSHWHTQEKLSDSMLEQIIHMENQNYENELLPIKHPTHLLPITHDLPHPTSFIQELPTPQPIIPTLRKN